MPVVLGKETVYQSIVRREEEETAITNVDVMEFLAYEAQSMLDATLGTTSGVWQSSFSWLRRG